MSRPEETAQEEPAQEEPSARSCSPGAASQSTPTPETAEQSKQMDLAGADATSMYAPSQHPGSATPWRPQPFDDSATVNSNLSIATAEIEYVWEHGRRYCGDYHLPNDKHEQMRQLLYHVIYKTAFPGNPTTVPLDNPTRILDIGAGTGEWAMDAAEAYPDCEVTGTDIAGIFSRYAPPNLFWEIDDAELEWLREPNSYDLVHLRNMTGAFRDWSYIYQQAFKVCKPGGWIEVMDKDELQGPGHFMGFFPPSSIIHQLFRDWKEAGKLSGRPLGIDHIRPELLRDAGFVDITLTERIIPVSPTQMETGHLFLKTLIDAIESFTMRLLTNYKGYTAEEVRRASVRIAKDLRQIALNPERGQKFRVKYIIVAGRKPEEGATPDWGSESTDSDAANVETPATPCGPTELDAMLQRHIVEHKYDVNEGPATVAIKRNSLARSITGR